MSTATFAWPTAGLHAQPDTSDYKPRCAAGCGRRTRGLLIPTCGDAACEQIDSRYERMRDRWADQ